MRKFVKIDLSFIGGNNSSKDLTVYVPSLGNLRFARDKRPLVSMRKIYSLFLKKNKEYKVSDLGDMPTGLCASEIYYPFNYNGLDFNSIIVKDISEVNFNIQDISLQLFYGALDLQTVHYDLIMFDQVPYDDRFYTYSSEDFKDFLIQKVVCQEFLPSVCTPLGINIVPEVPNFNKLHCKSYSSI